MVYSFPLFQSTHVIIIISNICSFFCFVTFCLVNPDAAKFGNFGRARVLTIITSLSGCFDLCSGCVVDGVL